VFQNQAYQGEVMSKLFRVLAVAFIALGGVSLAQAQTRPVVTTLGPDFPKTEIFIGNSFFYSYSAAIGPAANPVIARSDSDEAIHLSQL
jgi:hypothetical protein